MKKQRPREAEADTAEATVSPETEITTTFCRRCGTQVDGLNGRYACGVCGWVNHWGEGHGELPGQEEDPDWP
ncbi:hypothetical protein [Streptomyces lasiicapitis]|uniref:hypothetical protein n=1 Tax=Streptomyces lasiicapitis TaxID=1923961 RepID=UPI003658FC62